MIQTALKAISGLLFPPICIHCRDQIPDGLQHFCRNCFDQLTLIDPSDRCPLCFSSQYQSESQFCFSCLKNPPVLDRIAASFDYYGPAASLVRKMKYGGHSYLAEGIAAYMAAQFLQTGWQFPDYIVPVPMSTAHKLERGFNQSQLIADSLSLLIGKPVLDALKRRSGDYSQAGLTRTQRLALSRSGFQLRVIPPLKGKTLLLIDDVLTTGSTLRRCAETLYETYPKNIYGLVFARAVKA